MLKRPVRIFVLAVLAFLFFAGPSMIRFYTDWLWFGEIGYQQVFLTMLRAQGTLFTITFAIAAVWLAVNLRVALGATACSGSERQVARPAVGKEKTAPLRAKITF